MNVGQLIAQLQKLDPETIVAKFHGDTGLGYDECHFTDGSQTAMRGLTERERQAGQGYLIRNRAKREKGVGRADFFVTTGPTQAKTYPFVIIY